MLPPGHIEYAWGALNLAQRRLSLFREADYRLVALAAILPDLIDKPLALFVLSQHHTGHLFGHTLLLHLAAITVVLLWRRQWLVYALAFASHLIADQMWLYPKTLLYPLLGWEFQTWRFLGSPGAMWLAYHDLLVGTPELIICELVGLGILGWLVASHRLYKRNNLVRFLWSGRFAEREGVAD